MNFENNLKQLEKLSEDMEKDVTLEEGIALYEKALGLTKECLTDLNALRTKIDVLKTQMDDLFETDDEGE